MRWSPSGRSSDLEDRRGQSRGIGLGGRGIHIGLGGALVLLALSLIFHQDFFSMLAGGGVDTGPAMVADSSAPPVQSSPEEEKLVDFVSFVLDDDQGLWDQLLPKTYGVPYQHAKLVLYRDVTETGCGVGEAATGPFYCPSDQKLYVDLSFYDELRQRFGAPGDFAQAYVLAHEIGHNVQALLGTDAKVRSAARRNPSQANALSVRLELQADCYAGVWGHSAAQRNKLDPGDAQEGLQAAAAVGDDRLQRMSAGRVDVDSFTHGSSEQRMQWFSRGFESGDPRTCDTFSAAM
ncbi:MAG TPA: neutral zinc metallopeptidase [Gemmatimonadaceae bacterium]|nr:neutral zinc metallopeptidase [Gemmatimonadaceae bacterium]